MVDLKISDINDFVAKVLLDSFKQDALAAAGITRNIDDIARAYLQFYVEDSELVLVIDSKSESFSNSSSSRRQSYAVLYEMLKENLPCSRS
jgi:hypothetical protein